jgi:hypothetical protein
MLFEATELANKVDTELDGGADGGDTLIEPGELTVFPLLAVDEVLPPEEPPPQPLNEIVRVNMQATKVFINWFSILFINVKL